MKLATPTTTATHDDLLAELLSVAVDISIDSRRRVQAEQDDILIKRPVERWTAAAERASDGRLTQAARMLPKLAAVEMRPHVRAAVGRALEAIQALAGWRPEYRRTVLRWEGAIHQGEREVFEVPTWTVTPECVVDLRERRDVVQLRLVELEELHRDHPDALSRAIAVMTRAAGVEPTEADGRVSVWLAKFAEGAEGDVGGVG